MTIYIITALTLSGVERIDTASGDRALALSRNYHAATTTKSVDGKAIFTVKYVHGQQVDRINHKQA